jgi:hypothetical protein
MGPVYNQFLYSDRRYGGSWLDLTDFLDKDWLEDLSFSMAGAAPTPAPIAATWSAVLRDDDAIFFPLHPTSVYKNLIVLGRKVRLSLGVRVGGVDYYWERLVGKMAKPSYEGNFLTINVAGYDFMQVLVDTKLKSPDNYWGTSTTISTVPGQYNYSMPAGCTGCYYAIWNGDPIYSGNDWTYDDAANEFVFNSDKVIGGGVNNLTVYYFTAQVPEEVVADLLVAAGLYATQADALSAMDYVATGVTIQRVWFDSGSSVRLAIEKICELLDYRFYFSYDNTPVFRPAPTAKAEGAEDLELTQNEYSGYRCYDNEDIFYNRIVIEGEEQASPIWKQDAQPNRLRGEASDTDSIDYYGERTWPITNHLFQDQTTLDAMCDYYLALYKDPKRYFEFTIDFSAIPLELGDTVRVQVRLDAAAGKGALYGKQLYSDFLYADNGIVIVQRGLVRDIKVSKFDARYVCEEVD